MRLTLMVYSYEHLGFVEMMCCWCWVPRVDILDRMFEDVSFVVMLMVYVDLLILRTYRVLHV